MMRLPEDDLVIIAVATLTAPPRSTIPGQLFRSLPPS
jgi:hypothetical protein